MWWHKTSSSLMLTCIHAWRHDNIDILIVTLTLISMLRTKLWIRKFGQVTKFGVIHKYWWHNCIEAQLGVELVELNCQKKCDVDIKHPVSVRMMITVLCSGVELRWLPAGARHAAHRQREEVPHRRPRCGQEDSRQVSRCLVWFGMVWYGMVQTSPMWSRRQPPSK